MINLNNNSLRRRKKYSQMSEINVTPFVDVMLVLLIVFMVTVKFGSEIYLGGSKVAVENLIPRLNAITELNKEARIYVRGDRVVAYGRIMEIMSLVNSAGYIKVALVTQNPKEN